MKYFLLTEQDLDEIIWEVEYLLWQVTDMIREKFEDEIYEEDPPGKEEDNY